MSTSENPHRLPRTVVPRRYDLTLTPDLAAATFDVSEAIAVEVVEPTAEVVLNAVDMEIDEAAAQVGDERLVAAVSLDEATERDLFATLSERLPTATIVCITHRPGLEVFHDRIVEVAAAPRGAIHSQSARDVASDEAAVTAVAGPRLAPLPMPSGD